jgi:hypothetical protein
MIRSAYEEKVAAEIEAGLRADDSSWSRRVDALVAELGGRRRVHPVLPIVCLLAGFAFLVAGRLGWLSLELATLSGVSIPFVRLAFTLALGTVALTSMVLLGRVAYDRRQRGLRAN